MDDARPRFQRSRPHHPSLTFALVVAALCCVAPCLSADDPAPPDRWEFRITATVMAADLAGTTQNVWGRTVGGSIAYVERDYSDSFLDPQPLYLVDLAASHGPWGVVVRGQLLDWDNEVLLENRTLVEETTWFVETDISHRVGAHWIVFVGFRYVDLEHSEQVLVDFSPPDWPPLISSWGHTWLDPLVGATSSYRHAHRWCHPGPHLPLVEWTCLPRPRPPLQGRHPACTPQRHLSAAGR